MYLAFFHARRDGYSVIPPNMAKKETIAAREYAVHDFWVFINLKFFLSAADISVPFECSLSNGLQNSSKNEFSSQRLSVSRKITVDTERRINLGMCRMWEQLVSSSSSFLCLSLHFLNIYSFSVLATDQLAICHFVVGGDTITEDEARKKLQQETKMQAYNSRVSPNYWYCQPWAISPFKTLIIALHMHYLLFPAQITAIQGCTTESGRWRNTEEKSWAEEKGHLFFCACFELESFAFYIEPCLIFALLGWS